MNNDFANFIVEFTTKNLQEVKDGIKDLGDKIDEVNKKFKDADKSSGSFLSGLDRLEKKLLAIGVAVTGLGLKKAFDIKNESLELQRFSAETGVATQNIEALGLALKFNGFGGDKNTAANFFNNIVDMRARWRRGEVGKDQIEEMARAGFTIDPNAGIDAWIEAISVALHNQTDAGQRNLLASAFGLDDAMKLYLSEGPDYVKNTLKEAGAETWLYQPEVAKKSAELNKNWEMFKNDFNKMFSDEWLKTTNDLVIVLQKLEPTLGDLVNYLGEQVGQTVRGVGSIVDIANGDKNLDEMNVNEKRDIAHTAMVGWMTGLGALIGVPWLGLVLGNILSPLAEDVVELDEEKKRLVEAIGGKENIDMEDWKKWLDDKPFWWKTIHSMDYAATEYLKEKMNLPEGEYWNMPIEHIRALTGGNTVNITIDPTKVGKVTVNPDGSVVTDGINGMTPLVMGVK